MLSLNLTVGMYMKSWFAIHQEVEVEAEVEVEVVE